MAEHDDTYKAFDLALRVGEILLCSGAGAADVVATMVGVARACGINGVTADVTYTDLTLRQQLTAGEPTTIQVRRVTRREVDYSVLTQVDRIVHDLAQKEITRDDARDAVARVVSTGPPRSRWAVTIGWGVMGAGVAIMLGGRPVVVALAFLTAGAIHRTQRLMSRYRLPPFYQQVAGAALATVVAAVALAVGLDVNPSRVVTAGIVMLLAGIGVMGATQDAITEYPVTASARLLDALLATTGIVGGVSAGISLGKVFGQDLGAINPGTIGSAAVGAQLIGAAVAAAAFAYASYASIFAVLAVALVGALGQGVWVVLHQAELASTFASVGAAIAVGAVCHTVAGRFRVPPLVVVVPAIVPLLPGLAIYRGLTLLADGQDGIPQLISAAATAIALAAGVILGQYLSRPFLRDATRLEHRLVGPRLVGSRIVWRKG